MNRAHVDTINGIEPEMVSASPQEDIPMKMNTVRNIGYWLAGSLLIMVASSTHADTVNYSLDNVLLIDGSQISGDFDWTYTLGDFEGGSGVFNSLVIPYSNVYTFATGTLNIGIETNAIEISGNGNYHDAGLDITLKFLQPFSPAQSTPVDLGLSFFECCGNGFKSQAFQSGSISPNISLDGDYNADGEVDAADYTVWRDNEGSVAGTLPNDADGGVIGIAQYNTWVANFGATAAASSHAVPEPNTLLLFGVVGTTFFARKPFG